MTTERDVTVRRTTKLELGLVFGLIINGVGIGIFIGEVRGLARDVSEMTTELRSFRAQAPTQAVLLYRVEQLEIKLRSK